MTDQTSTTHRYYFTNRPPMYGTLPAGFTTYEQWLPGRQAPGMGPHPWLGWADYPEALSIEQVWQYELWPADLQQRGWYALWRDNGRDMITARHLQAEYVALGTQTLLDLVADPDNWDRTPAWVLWTLGVDVE